MQGCVTVGGYGFWKDAELNWDGADKVLGFMWEAESF